MVYRIFFASLVVFVSAGLRAQLPIEVFAGHEKTTLDLLFFRNIKNRNQQNTPFLFFNRNRASVDYRQTTTAFLPQFGFTEALSYNAPRLHGLAPVLVAQLLNRGVFPKAGVQYFMGKSDFSFFTWLVTELLERPNLDVFVLTRYEPALKGRLHLFTQVELVSAFPTADTKPFAFVQRLRLGLKTGSWQYGLGVDFAQTGRSQSMTRTQNAGVFLRQVF